MGRPTKSFRELVADGTFRRRNHQHLLDDAPMLRDPGLRSIQEEYLAATSEPERNHFALEFEKAVRGESGVRRRSLGEQMEVALAECGPAKSWQQVVGFFEHFFSWDEGSRFVLDEWQRDFIELAYRRDKHGRRVFKEILLGIPRGNGKTPLAAGLGLHALLAGEGRPKVFQAAGSGEQAALGLEYASNWVEDGELGEFLSIASSNITRLDRRGKMSILKASGSLGDGRKPNVGIIDEWHAFTTKAQTRTYTALETALHKVQEAYLLAITTAGHDKASQLGQAFDTGLKLPHVETYREGFLTIAWDEESGRLMVWYGLPEGYELDLEDDRAVLQAIKLSNPGSWIDHHELLRALRRTRDPLEWIRLNVNGWTKVKGAWLPTGAVRGLVDLLLEIPDGSDIYVAVDAAHSYDTTAVAWAWRSPGGRVVERARVWSVREEAPAHEYVDDFYNAGAEHVVEAFVHNELAGRYRIREIVGDPNYFGAELRRLGKRFLTAPMFPQSHEMREAVQEFRRESDSGGIAIDDDPVVREHLEGIAGAKNIDGYWEIRKLNEPNPIDAGTALIMAHSRAARSERRRSVYEERDLRVIEPDDAPVDDDEEEDEGELIRRRRRAVDVREQLEDEDDDW